MPRIKMFHLVTVTLPNNKVKKIRSIGCKPYVLAIRWRVDGRLNEWHVHQWCSTYGQAEKLMAALNKQYAGWSHKQPEMAVLNTSCHIATGINAGGPNGS